MKNLIGYAEREGCFDYSPQLLHLGRELSTAQSKWKKNVVVRMFSIITMAS